MAPGPRGHLAAISEVRPVRRRVDLLVILAGLRAATRTVEL